MTSRRAALEKVERLFMRSTGLVGVAVKAANRCCKRYVSIWQGLGNRNITFTDELDFEISELDIVYKRSDEN